MTAHHTAPAPPAPWQALVFVRLSQVDTEPFEHFLRRQPAVVAAWHVVGDIDLAVQLRCDDLAELDRVVTAMRTEGRAEHTNTHLVVHHWDRPDRPVARSTRK